MKYVITGSLGNISRPIVKQLVAAQHEVKVISSSQARADEITSLGAKPAIGSIEDREFLKQTFRDADAVYLMIPPNWVVEDFPVYQKLVADNYIYAVKENNVPRVVLLSSIGAHLRTGAGPIDGLAYLEVQLGMLPATHVVMLRPAYFYTNFFTMMPLLKQAGIMGANFGSTGEKMVLVHPADIAAEAVKHLLKPDFTGQHVQYVSSDEKHPSEIAQIIGAAINQPGVNWVTFNDEDTRQAMLQSGMKSTMAGLYVQMGKSFREGLAQEDYFRQKVAPAGKIKLGDFAAQFSGVYKQS